MQALLNTPLPSPDATVSSAPPLSPMTATDKDLMLARALRGELTPADTRRYIESIRSGFTATATAPKKAAAKTPKELPTPTSDAADFF